VNSDGPSFPRPFDLQTRVLLALSRFRAARPPFACPFHSTPSPFYHVPTPRLQRRYATVAALCSRTAFTLPSGPRGFGKKVILAIPFCFFWFFFFFLFFFFYFFFFLYVVGFPRPQLFLVTFLLLEVYGAQVFRLKSDAFCKWSRSICTFFFFNPLDYTFPCDVFSFLFFSRLGPAVPPRRPYLLSLVFRRPFFFL